MSSTDLETRISCPVCLSRYNIGHREPRQFGCGHNVCAVCVRQLPPGLAECPLCRYREPTRTARHLPANRGMCDLLQVLLHLGSLPAEEDPEPEPVPSSSVVIDRAPHRAEASANASRSSDSTMPPTPATAANADANHTNESRCPDDQLGSGHHAAFSDFFHTLASSVSHDGQRQDQAHIQVHADGNANEHPLGFLFRGLFGASPSARSNPRITSSISRARPSSSSSSGSASPSHGIPITLTITEWPTSPPTNEIRATFSTIDAGESGQAAGPAAAAAAAAPAAPPSAATWNPPVVEELDAPRFYKISLGRHDGLHMAVPGAGPNFKGIYVICPTGTNRARMLIYGTEEAPIWYKPVLKSYSLEFDLTQWINPVRPMFVALTPTIYLHVDSTMKRLLWSELTTSGRRDVVVYDWNDAAASYDIVGLHGQFNRHGAGSSCLYMEVRSNVRDCNAPCVNQWDELPFDTVRAWALGQPIKMSIVEPMRSLANPPRDKPLRQIRNETGVRTAVAEVLDNDLSTPLVLTYEQAGDGREHKFAICAKNSHHRYISGPPSEVGSFEMDSAQYAAFTHTPTDRAFRPLMTMGIPSEPHLWIAFENQAGNVSLVFVNDPTRQ